MKWCKLVWAFKAKGHKTRPVCVYVYICECMCVSMMPINFRET